jgi:hypothetical protein
MLGRLGAQAYLTPLWPGYLGWCGWVVFCSIEYWVWGLESVIGDPGFENWLVNRVLGWLSERGVRLPEFIVSELQLVSDGVRLRLLEVVEFKRFNVHSLDACVVLSMN